MRLLVLMLLSITGHLKNQIRSATGIVVEQGGERASERSIYIFIYKSNLHDNLVPFCLTLERRFFDRPTGWESKVTELVFAAPAGPATNPLWYGVPSG